MANSSESNRRDFLTGRAARRELKRRGEQIADAVLEAGEHRPIPEGSDTIRLETRAMACAWAVVMNPGLPRQVMVASDALDRVHQVEEQLTVYRDDSEIAGVNRSAADSPQPVSESLFSFLEMCRDLWTRTEGAFDPASGALIRLWRSARQEGRVPDPDEIQTALSGSGMQHVVLDAEKRTVRFSRTGALFDFGAIGKGYAVDQAVEHLQREGISDFLVHGGHSSLFAMGSHGGHEGWPVGIKNPLFTERRYATILLRNRGMSTSGSNIQYFRNRGRRYGHILDPRTGWPSGELLSVTVIAPTAAEADSLSTAFYVMGLDKAIRYCDDHGTAGAILIPIPAHGRILEPIVHNLPEDCLFFEDSPG